MIAAAILMVRALKLKLSQPGTGKLRRRGKVTVGKRKLSKRGSYRSKIGGLDRASAPGEPPAVDQGALRNSINWEQRDFGRVVVGTNSEYAEPLEFGTNKIAPRPFFRPVLVEVRTAMGEVIKGELRSAARK